MSPTFDLSVVSKSNELDGDPDRLDHLVSVFHKNAGYIADANTNLGKITSESGENRARGFTALAGKANEIKEGMDKTVLRYRLMAAAVSEFSTVLREEQSKVQSHIDGATQAKADYQVAVDQHQRAQNLARSVDPCDRQEATNLGAWAATRSQTASASLCSHREAIQQAADRVRAANERAASKVKTAMEESELDDTFLDKLADFTKKALDAVVEVGKWIWDNLETISLVIDVLSFVLMLIPPLTVVGAALKVLSAVAKVLRVISVVKFAVESGKSIWSAAQTGGAGAALGVAATIGVGFAARKIVSQKVGKLVSSRLYSLDKNGALITTEMGRRIHRATTEYGPPMVAAKGPLPSDFASRHIQRTTDLIAKSSSYVTDTALERLQALGQAPGDQNGYRYATCSGGGGRGW